MDNVWLEVSNNFLKLQLQKWVIQPGYFTFVDLPINKVNSRGTFSFFLDSAASFKPKPKNSMLAPG